MNSSGIKRGLAASAVAALAVAGIPALASSASANAGDTMSVLSQGPIRNGNATGGSVIIKSTSPNIDPAKMAVTPADFSGTPNPLAGSNDLLTPTTSVDLLDFDLLDGDPTDNGGVPDGDIFADGTYHYEADVAVTVSGGATSVSFGLVEDQVAGGPVEPSEAKTTVTVTPTGAPVSVDISTSQPATVALAPTPFTVEVKDAAGNVTQLAGTETVDISATATTAAITDPSGDDSLDAADLVSGKATVYVSWTDGGNKTVTADGNADLPSSVIDSQSVTVYENADVDPDEFALDTGADTWKDFETTFGGTAQVRVDQNSVTFRIVGTDLVGPAGADDAGKVVALQLSSATIKFNGTAADAQPYVVPILLDSSGKGTATVALSGVTDTGEFTFASPTSSIGSTTVEMRRAAAASTTPDSSVYVTKVGGSTAVTVTVEDQFGNPVGAPAQVSITRGTRNGSTTTDRVAVDASGKATINLPDAGTAPGSETIALNLFEDQFSSSDLSTATATINYTADGLGGDFVATTATGTIAPLYDSNTGGGAYTGDSATVNIINGTPLASANVSVDGGALILQTGESKLTEGAASDTVTLGAGGNGSFKVVGTKAGAVTVTIVSGGRTKTVAMNVAQPSDPAVEAGTARNISVKAPEEALAGEVATYEITVTDEFGNPVAGYDASNLALQVSGPGNSQGTTEAASDASGVIHANVILSDNADSPVTLRVLATGAQFGDKANEVGGVSAPGVKAPTNTASATISDVTNLAELEQAVEDAQDKVDLAQDNLDTAKGEKSVAVAEKKVAQQAVKAAKKDLKKAKKKHKGVQAAKKALRDARGDLKVAKAKVKATQGKVNRAKDRLAAAQAELEAAQQALEDAQS